MIFSFPLHFHIYNSVIVHIPKKQLKQTFKQHDANGNSSLILEELMSTFVKLDSFISTWTAHLSLIHADTNRDGKISSEEMKTLINYAMSLGYQMSRILYIYVCL